MLSYEFPKLFLLVLSHAKFIVIFAFISLYFVGFYCTWVRSRVGEELHVRWNSGFTQEWLKIAAPMSWHVRSTWGNSKSLLKWLSNDLQVTLTTHFLETVVPLFSSSIYALVSREIPYPITLNFLYSLPSPIWNSLRGDLSKHNPHTIWVLRVYWSIRKHWSLTTFLADKAWWCCGIQKASENKNPRSPLLVVVLRA